MFWPLWKSASPESRRLWPNALQHLIDELREKKIDETELALALNRLGHKRLNEFLEGVQKYRQADFKRETPSPPTMWQEGTTRLLAYSGERPENISLLVIPSLVNRYYVMDLLPERSFLRFLADSGFRVFAVDWDRPSEAERGFGLADYIFRLERALAEIGAIQKGPVFVLGYCMGGLLALALALRQQKKIAGFLGLATPFDFRAGQETTADMIAQYGCALSPCLDQWGEMPVDYLQASFAMLDPVAILNKFRAFARRDVNSFEARHFIALEDWLNDGVPLAAPLAKECLIDWYGANKPLKREWRVGDKVVDPGDLKRPSFLALPAADRIVPPESARALARALPNPLVIEPHAGHIGMMVGSKAESLLWRPITDWLYKNS